MGGGGGKVHRQKDLIGMIPSLIDSFVLVCMSQPGNYFIHWFFAKGTPYFGLCTITKN